MEAILKVKRFNPEAAKPEPYWQEYRVEVEPHFTVLDALIKIREEKDETLSLRCSCRSAICGSCAMRINGHATLACKTKLSEMARGRPAVTVEPAGNMPTIKDLVADMTPFWSKVMAVEPWLQPRGPEPQGEYLAPADAMQHLVGVMACIMCGACVSDCTVLEIDPNFLGPAALAKAYRFVGDPRDQADAERLQALSRYSGIWDCTRCNECVQACPKGIAPMDRIMALRDRAMDAGFRNNTGSRHTEAFEEIVEHSGRLDELRLAIKTFGMMNVPAMLGLAPVGLRALMRGKMPPIFHKPIPNAQAVQKLFKKVEEAQKGDRK
ncbi:MAG: succinate dehydrogenase iron-sulfur subunit [Chloroflexi bacterium]|nr:succinate dehydrogenase iron-sulfur subunit [Chloroflexota bacterium]